MTNENNETIWLSENEVKPLFKGFGLNVNKFFQEEKHRSLEEWAGNYVHREFANIRLEKGDEDQKFLTILGDYRIKVTTSTKMEKGSYPKRSADTYEGGFEIKDGRIDYHSN